MGYPIKTSNDSWLNKVIELHKSRISMDIIDDGEYGIKESVSIRKIISQTTLSRYELFFLFLFYLLAFICSVLYVFSLSLERIRLLAEIMSIVAALVCIAIPSYYLWKNRSPKINETEKGLEVRF
jgi:hypothetical protein